MNPKSRSVIAQLIGFITLIGSPGFSNPPDDAREKVRQIVAHRGSSADRPENTLASTKRAIEVGATAVEVDVRTTKDGHLVLRHDATLDRKTNGKGLVSEKTLAEIQRLDAGSWFDPVYYAERVPTLAEVLRECRGKIDVLLDLKETGDEYAHRVAHVVTTQGDPGRTIVGVRSVEQAREFPLVYIPQGLSGSVGELVRVPVSAKEA